VGNVAGDVLRPFFRGVEANDPNRVLVLSIQHVHDDRFEIGPLDVCLAEGPTAAAEVVDDDIDILILAIRHDRRRPAGSAHCSTPRNRTEISSAWPIIGSVQPGLDGNLLVDTRSFQNRGASAMAHQRSRPICSRPDYRCVSYRRPRARYDAFRCDPRLGRLNRFSAREPLRVTAERRLWPSSHRLMRQELLPSQ
jgi:hypothetical protein